MVEWHALSGKEALERFESSETGISGAEAGKRVGQYGKNVIESAGKVSALALLLEQFTSPLVLILIAASIISFSLGKGIDGALIISIVILNGIFGFIQNYNAEKSIEALKKLGAPKALVYRNGSLQEISAEEIVPGDVLHLAEGLKVAADARLLEESNIAADESILTGESTPASKNTETLPEETLLSERRNMVYMHTSIVRGHGRALVVATGKSTEVGKIAGQLESIREEPTRFHTEIEDLSKKITLGISALVVLIALAMLFLHGESFFDVFITAISVAVAAIPEGLPAVVTLSLAIGTGKMLKKKSLVRKLSVVETIGSVDVICTDKTGTLTENSMTVQEIFSGGGLFKVGGTGRSVEGSFELEGRKANPERLREILLCGMACNDTIIEGGAGGPRFIGDPTEIALTVSALKGKVSLEGMERVKDFPFTSERKRMTVIMDYGARKAAYSKGAPEVIIESCTHVLHGGKVKPFTKAEKEKLLQQNSGMASRALRVLGFAYREIEGIESEKEAEKGMVFLGLQGMIDPPRKEVAKALKTAREAGIRVMMLTGDNKATAEAIGKAIGFEGKIIDAAELEKLSEQEFAKAVEEHDIFARVGPEHKLKVMRALKEKGHSVAMTGDGVNDAPALKQADVGIAMGIRGSDVAKEASDIVLLDDNFATIVEAVRQGRTVFENIQKFVNYLLTNNFAEVLIIFFASLAGFLPITPVQILWMNLLTDGMPALALGADPPKPGIMREKPRGKGEGIIGRHLGFMMAAIGGILTIIILAIFFHYLPKGIVLAQSMVFTALIAYEFVRIVVIREQSSLGFFSNKWLVAALFLSVLMQFAVLYTPAAEWFNVVPLSLGDWGVIALGGIIAYVSSVLATKFILARAEQKA